ncbi:hypothetical protein COEREDRAFT_83274 [Coemansia reversa NRRL 1564]|uniref:Uncharacterized protein n=1 Tax=Coemansia reversa (strain ATCC 12441 / NRRL 1564) TaxID=763665 RepID=A0A2G5B469_COERN|nr:hypothetical protein COEREDRAFT_83274 [Coemansia reversa NRRL 1564]|eukprot:PIA13796.1 hypothetical protein COEREDRAFT_83274 [Coemansia reversa NRRL 1564]
MKLLLPGILLTALAACATATADASDQGIQAAPHKALVRRQGLLDVASVLADDSPPSTNKEQEDQEDQDAESPTPDNNDDDKNTSKEPVNDTEPSESPSSTKQTTSSSSSSPSSAEDDKTDDDKPDKPSSSESDDVDTTKSSSKPTPTGEACPKDGEKRCASSGNGYQECQDGVWSDQSCGGSDVCGKDEDGGVACMDKDQATMSRESCSKKGEQRCEASDDTKYQTCDGKHWQTFSCEKGKCNMDGNKVVCGDVDGDGGGSITYTMHEPTAFVPPTNIASPLRAAFGTAAAAFVLAAALSSVGI